MQFLFSNFEVEITESFFCRRRKKRIVQKEEIANIMFDYHQGKHSTSYSLHIMFKNGEQNNYFEHSSCFTSHEVEYFNNEVRRLLDN